MRGRLTPLLSFLLFPLLIAACSGSGTTKVATSDIVSTIPWPQKEDVKYLLVDKNGKQTGTADLTVSVEGPTTRLGQIFTNGQNRDETSTTVDSQSLKPRSSTRTITSPKKKEELSVTYSSEGASIKQGDRQTGLSVPEHAYDNDTSLFLWRTLRFEPGYEAAYITIITNRRNRLTVGVKVLGREMVSVPAGDFETWRLEINAGNAKQTAWYADTQTRPLVKYDNSIGTFFELQSKP